MKKTLACMLMLGSFVASAEVSLVGAADLSIKLPSNSYDGSTVGANDPDFMTGLFDVFSFSPLRATSLYDIDGSGQMTGTFTDTNDLAVLASYGMTYDGSGNPNIVNATSVDGSTTVALRAPDIAAGETEVGVLTNISQSGIGNRPGLPVKDDEGYGDNWILDVEFDLKGQLNSSNEPDFTSGSFDLMFVDFLSGTSTNFLSASLISSTVAISGQAAAVSLDFLIDSVNNLQLFSNIDGNQKDIGTAVANGEEIVLRVGFDVDPAIPTPSTLGVISDGTTTVYARQSNLSGGAHNPLPVPEPSSIALFALGLLGLSRLSKKKRAH